MLFNWDEWFIVDTTNLGLQPSMQKAKRFYIKRCLCCNFSEKLDKNSEIYTKFEHIY